MRHPNVVIHLTMLFYLLMKDIELIALSNNALYHDIEHVINISLVALFQKLICT